MGGGVEMSNVIEEICSIMQKSLKENQECTNGDYFENYLQEA